MKTHNRGHGAARGKPPAQRAASPSRWKRVPAGVWVAGLLCGLSVVFYWPVLSGRGFLWNDFPEQNFPYRLFAAVSVRNGTFPFWNPYVFSGMPFFADIQTAVLYPLNIILTLFASKEWLHPLVFEYQIVFHFFLAGLFTYLMCREFGLKAWGAVFGAITFMFCAFLTVHIFHVNLIHTAVWFPCAVLFCRRMLERTSILYACLAALALAAAFLAGYPQLVLHIYYWLGCFLLFSLALHLRSGSPWKAQTRRSALFAAAVVLSIGMAAVQLLPTRTLGDNSARPTISFTESCEGSFRPYRFITLLIPGYFGDQRGRYWGIAPDDINPGVHSYWETAMYCGILPLILAVLCLCYVRGPTVWFFGGMGLLALVCAMGNSFFLYWFVYKLLPGINRFRVPARFAFLFSLSVAYCAGSGLQWLMHNGRSTAPKTSVLLTRIFTGLLAAGLLAGIAVSSGALKGSVASFLLDGGIFGADAAAIERFVADSAYPRIVQGYWTFYLFLFLSTAAVLLSVRRVIAAAAAGVACCAIVFADLYLFGNGYAGMTGPRNDPSAMFRKTATVRMLRKQGEEEFFRVNSRDSNPGTDDLGGRHMLFRRNQGSVHRLFLTEGYNPLRLKRQLTDRRKRTLDLLNVKYTVAEDKKSFAFNSSYLPRARMVYQYVVETEEQAILQRLYDTAFDYRRTVILEEEPDIPAPSAVADTDTVSWSARISRYGLNAITTEVTTQRAGLLVLSEIHYPAWRARVDGEPVPVYRADYALRAIPVPAGNHTVLCTYESGPFRQGAAVSAVSLLLAAGMLVTIVLKRTRIRTDKGAVSGEP